MPADDFDSSDFTTLPDGLDLETGEPYHPGLSRSELGALIRGSGAEAPGKPDKNRLPRHRVDPLDLASAGWAVIFPRDGGPEVRRALEPLLELRRKQAGRFFRELSGEEGLRPGESATELLLRLGILPGTAPDPRRLPYYLLLAGGPEEIPWEVQHQLDGQYAVGRAAFDTPEEHGIYARQVVAAEAGSAAVSRRALFFGAETPDDARTRILRELLADRLAQAVAADRPDWTVESVPAGEATHERLGRRLAGPEAPSLLFTAGHGQGCRPDDPSQRERQGSLICRREAGGLAGFTADALPEGARFPGLVAFQYSCHSAGTPRLDVYSPPHEPQRELTPRGFVARFPQRLLTRGALAFVGHVERTWGYSFLWKGAGSQPTAFEDTLLSILDGQPVGHALEAFGQRSGSLAGSYLGERRRSGSEEDPLTARLWQSAQDARTYVLLGDPAVRLPGAQPLRAGSRS